MNEAIIGSNEICAETKKTNMTSRTPSPDFMHPEATFFRGVDERPQESTLWTCVTYVPQQRMARNSIHPRLLWNVTSPTRPSPTWRLQQELDSFVGWLLELLTILFSRSYQLRRQLNSWQARLRWRCRNLRLRWHEAFAVYAIELEL